MRRHSLPVRAVAEGALRRRNPARGRAVAARLRPSGVPGARAFVGPRGPLPFGQAPLERRRVEIRLSPG